MRIERIEQSKHKQGRVLVYLEGGELLRITGDELLRFGLCTGLDMEAETVVELKKSARRSEARTRAAQLLSARPLSRSELKQRLSRGGAAEEDAEAAALWLEEIGALDDLAYAKALVRHYSASGFGAAKLRDELRRRGVPRELWDEALACAPDASETIARVIAAKAGGVPSDEKARRRLSALLLRRGFAWSEVRPALSLAEEE